jgi:hypothetical protein
LIELSLVWSSDTVEEGAGGERKEEERKGRSPPVHNYQGETVRTLVCIMWWFSVFFVFVSRRVESLLSKNHIEGMCSMLYQLH